MSPDQEAREERIEAWAEERGLDRNDPLVQWLAEADDETGLPFVGTVPPPHPDDPF